MCAYACTCVDGSSQMTCFSHEVLRKVIFTGRCLHFFSFGVVLWNKDLKNISSLRGLWFHYYVGMFLLKLILPKVFFVYLHYFFFSCSVSLWAFLATKLLKEEQKRYQFLSFFHCGSYCLYDQSRPPLRIFYIRY